MSCLTSIDTFGKGFKFKIKNTKYKTQFGGVLSILLVIGAFVSFWYFGQDIYQRKKPRYLMKVQNTNTYPFVTLNETNFFFAFALYDNSNVPITDPTYFNYIFTYYKFDRNPTTKLMERVFKKINYMNPCTNGSLPEDANITDIVRENIVNYYCFDMNNITIGGEFSSSDTFYITRFSIDWCNSNAETKYGIKCKSEDEIYAKYKDNTHVQSYLMNKYIDPLRPEDSITANLDYRFENVDIASVKENRIFFTKNKLRSDRGLVYSEFEEENFFNYDYINNDYYSYQITSMNSINFYFQFTSNEIIFERSYLKLQEVSAIVGGFLSIVTSIFDFFYSFYFKAHLSLYLYENLFQTMVDIDEIANGMENSVNEKSKTGNSIELGKDVSFKRLVKVRSRKLIQDLSKKRGEKVPNEDIEKYSQNLKKSREKINLSLSENCVFMFCSKRCHNNQTFQMLNYVEAALGRMTNIVQLLKNIDQLNLLTKLSLNENQNFMLKNKDLKIVTKNMIEENYENYKEKQIKTNTERLILYIKKRLEDKYICSTDKMLYLHLSPELKK